MESLCQLEYLESIVCENLTRDFRAQAECYSNLSFTIRIEVVLT